MTTPPNHALQRTAAGREVRAQFAHVWGVRGGRVVRFQQYTDTKQFAEAATV